MLFPIVPVALLAALLPIQTLALAIDTRDGSAIGQAEGLAIRRTADYRTLRALQKERRSPQAAQNKVGASATCLNANTIQTGSAQSGQTGTVTPGQVASVTDSANFINHCAGQTLTNGLQVKNGSCNGIIMGQIPATTNMISSVIMNPTPGEVVPAFTTFNITVQIQNLVAGHFTNAQSTYYSAPQALDSQGHIIGHTHVTVQDMGKSFTPSKPLDPTTFAFFKGINDAGNGQGLLNAVITGGLPDGFYRVCTMIAAANHQPVMMPVAQRGAQDDCTKFRVVGAGKPSSTVSSKGAAATSKSASGAKGTTTKGAAAPAKGSGGNKKGAGGNTNGAGSNTNGSGSNTNGASPTTTDAPVNACPAGLTTSTITVIASTDAAVAASSTSTSTDAAATVVASSTEAATSTVVATSTAAATATVKASSTKVAEATSTKAATTTAKASTTVISSAAASTSVGAIVKSGNLGGSPPAVVKTGDPARPFGVNGNTFVSATNAVQRSCDIQFNTCANLANAGNLGGKTVGDCQTQKDSCTIG